jgi:DNA polymerase III subunit alpha
VNTANLAEHRDKKVELACVVTGIARQISKRNGQEWGRVTVEDFRGTATVLAFGEAWEKYREVLVQDASVLVRGQVSGRDRDEDDPPIFLDEALPLGLIRSAGSVGVEVRLSRGETAERIGEATAALRGSPGEAPLFVLLDANGGEGLAAGGGRFRSRSLRVAPTAELMTELKELFGPDRVRLVRAQG